MYHNTFYNCQLDGHKNSVNSAVTFIAKNNIFNTADSYFFTDTSNMVSTWNGNYYYKSGSTSGTNLWTWGDTAKNWDNLNIDTEQEANGNFGDDPNLDASGKLQALLEVNVDVSSEMSNWPDYDNDIDGNKRSGIWDLGAHEYNSLGPCYDNDIDSYSSSFCGGTDCNDSNDQINPGMPEIPYNSWDDDCNTSTPDDDLDQDSYLIVEDCNDSNASIYPDAPEICDDDIDQDCDGLDTNCTCQNQGYQCCDACQSGPHPEYDSDCPGQACCEACPAQYFLPEQYIEAEDGDLTSPMQTAANSTASGGYYIYTDTWFQGSANFTFDISQAGRYWMEARILAPNDAQDSFYVGLDGEPAQGDDNYTYDTIITDVFVWDNISLRGPNGNFSWSEFDPMVWELSHGLHTFTFYGRESDTGLDQIILRKIYHRADNNPQDGCIYLNELLAFIDRWQISSQDVPVPELMEAIGVWKSGTGCS
jgi:hypothetical protein